MELHTFQSCTCGLVPVDTLFGGRLEFYTFRARPTMVGVAGRGMEEFAQV